MNPEIIRAKSWKKVTEYNLPINYGLPFIDDLSVKKEVKDIIDRLLCLNTLMHFTYKGITSDGAVSWLEKNNLFNKLSTSEVGYLNTNKFAEDFRYNVEAMYMLAWILSLYENIHITDTVPDDLITKISVNTGKSVSDFSRSCRLRDGQDIIYEADLLYCLDWANKHYKIENKEERFYSYVIKYRRWATEWLISGESWEDIALDT